VVGRSSEFVFSANAQPPRTFVVFRVVDIWPNTHVESVMASNHEFQFETVEKVCEAQFSRAVEGSLLQIFGETL
jgi:hypothetical protein